MASASYQRLLSVILFSNTVTWINCIWALIAIVVGARWIIQRKVEVGIEGRTPAFVLAGSTAVVFGAIAILIGVFVLLKWTF